MFAIHDAKRMRVTESFVVDLSRVENVSHAVQIPVGFVFDGASIPRLAWPLVGHPFEPDLVKAACVHDWYCDHAIDYHDRVIGDAVFFKLLSESGVCGFRSSVLFMAVRLYAILFVRRKKKRRKK